ncbi:MAG: carboxypeptidase-like regulatory domain-containing protein [Bacteroidales bacterium]|nr:carboxypeptidase-like regulatory domain-containing protein [Bacteroidales bacterium]
MKRLVLIAFILTMGTLSAQEYVTLKGRITDSRTRKAVPYAAVLLQGTNTGTQSNDAGEWKLKIENGKLKNNDMVLFSAMGYKRLAVSVEQLIKKGDVRLEPHAMELKEVQVTGFVTPQAIIAEAVRRIPENYHTDTTIDTWFLRDYRLLDGNLYLFDESVMDVLRYGYAHDSTKRGYSFSDRQREMDNNYKSVLRHRLLVLDSLSVRLAAGDMPKAMADMAFSDNNIFSESMLTPQANFSTAERFVKRNKYDPIREYTDDEGVAYWVLRGYGRTSNPHFKAHYTLHIRQDNFAVVDYLFDSDSGRYDYPEGIWWNQPWTARHSHRNIDQEHYELRNGKYSLTHSLRYSDITYYCHQAYGYELANAEQRVVTCREMLLTDQRPGDTSFLRQRNVLGYKNQGYADAMGQSSYDEDFWGQYNTLPLDSAIREKLEAFYPTNRNNQNNQITQNTQSTQSTPNHPMILNPAAKQDSLVALRAAKDTTPATIAPLPRWVFYRYGGIGGNRLIGDDGKSRRGISQQLGLGTRLHLGGRFHLYADLQYAWMHTKADFGHLNTHSLTVPLRLSFDIAKPSPNFDSRLYVAVGGWGRYTFFGHVGNDTDILDRRHTAGTPQTGIIDHWDYGWSWTIGAEFFRTISLEWTSYRSLRTSMLDGSELFRHNGAFTLSINF